jgi:hypothetical protein
LIFEIIDQLRVLSILTHEGLLELKDRSINFDCAVSLEVSLDDGHSVVSDSHLKRIHITGTLGNLWLLLLLRVGALNEILDLGGEVEIVKHIEILLKTILRLESNSLEVVVDLLGTKSEAASLRLFKLAPGDDFRDVLLL